MCFCILFVLILYIITIILILSQKFREKILELLNRGTMNFTTSFISQESNISTQYRTGCVLSFVGISDVICVDDDGIVIATGKL